MHSHGEGYTEGSICSKCSRDIEQFECSVCGGTGKPHTPEWARVRNSCPACSGHGHVHNCPIGRLISLGEHFDGKTCATVEWADKLQ